MVYNLISTLNAAFTLSLPLTALMLWWWYYTPLAAEGRPGGKQRLANQTIPLLLCPKRKTTVEFCSASEAMSLGEKAKKAWQLWATTLKRKAMITRRSGKAESSKLVWKKSSTKSNPFLFRNSPTAGYPGVRGSPNSNMVDPLCVPVPGRYSPSGYTALPSTVQSKGSEYKMMPLQPYEPAFLACM